MFGIKAKNLVKANPTDLRACSKELSELLTKKLEASGILIVAILIKSTHFSVEFEVYEDGGSEVCSGFVSALGTISFYRYSKEETRLLREVLSESQVAKVKRWGKRYLEDWYSLQLEGVSK